MRKYAKALLISAAILLGSLALNTRGQIPSRGVTGKCTNGNALIYNSSSNSYDCGGTTLIYRATGVNLNAGANTDSGSTFTGLPSRYIVRRLTFDNASATPTLATVALRTAAAGGGSAIVTAQALSTLSASTTLVDSTLAVTTTVQTASTLYLRDVAAAGSAMTADATLEITPLP